MRGQRFGPHFDGYQGARDGSGFSASSRIATVFVYLNDCERGGATQFTALRPQLKIQPRRGLAVLHLPGRLDLSRDDRTEHESCEADDEKYVLVCQAAATTRPFA